MKIYLKILHSLLFFMSLQAIGQDFNLNKIANQYLTDGQTFYNCPNKNFACALKLEIIKTGRKDYDGNEILHLKLKQQTNMINTEEKEYLLLPDFEMHPMQYVVYIVDEYNEYSAKFYHDGSHEGDGYGRGRYNCLFLTPTKNGYFRTELNRYGSAGLNMQFTTKSLADDPAICEAYYKKNEENRKKELHNYLEKLLKYQDEQCAVAKQKGYDKMITDFFNSSETFKLIKKSPPNGASVFDAFKAIKDEATNNYKFHFPFEDGNYYDKDKFYSLCVKDADGFYCLKDESLVVKSGILVPFENFIIVVGRDRVSGQNTIKGFISNGEINVLMDIMEDGGDSNSASFVNWNFVNRIGCLDEYKIWAKVKTFEPTYQGGGDNLFLENFMTKYIDCFK